MVKAAATRFFCIAVSLTLSACGRYADFTLPPLSPAKPVTLQVRIDPAPVLLPGEWDSRDVLNPSVVFRDGLYWNFYSGFDGVTWHTGLAQSPDGIHWTKRGKVLSPDPKTWQRNYIAANGSVLVIDGEFWYWFQSGDRTRPQIALTRSRDGFHWRNEPNPVISYGPRGSWDEIAVADPYVLRQGEFLYLYYLGQDRARRQRLGVARSRDGKSWEKLQTSPLLETEAMDVNGQGEPAVWQSGGSYWLLFTGRDSRENRSLALARSQDGIHWTRQNEPIRGLEPWNAKVLCDPTVLVEGSRIRLWFGGGDVASPDENLHGRIGVGELTSP